MVVAEHAFELPRDRPAAALDLRKLCEARVGVLLASALWQDDDGLGPAVEGVNSFRRSVRQLAPS